LWWYNDGNELAAFNSEYWNCCGLATLNGLPKTGGGAPIGMYGFAEHTHPYPMPGGDQAGIQNEFRPIESYQELSAGLGRLLFKISCD